MQQWGLWDITLKKWLYDKDYNLYVYDNPQVAFVQAGYYEIRDNVRKSDSYPDNLDIYYEVKEFEEEIEE